MKSALSRKIAVFALCGLFSSLSMADNASSATEIAGILVAMNHFASDADKAKLAAIAADESLAGAVREMATAVAGIAHAATAEAKTAMAAIQAGPAETPERAKVMAGVIAGFNHMVSAEDKAKLTEMYAL